MPIAVVHGLLLSALGFGAFTIRGLTGAASALVFNASFLVLVALGLSGGLTLREGLYWVALADGLASAVMVALLRSRLRLERFTVLLLAGMLPVTVTFSLLLPKVDLAALEVVLAMVVVGAGTIMIVTVRRAPTMSERTLTRLAFPAGMGAGLLSGLFGMGGPPVILLLSRATVDTQRFRARMTTIAAVNGLFRVTVLLTSGVYTPEALTRFAFTTPAIVAGTAFGYWIHRFVRPEPFRAVLGALIVTAGCVALLESLRG